MQILKVFCEYERAVMSIWMAHNMHLYAEIGFITE